ncbi:MAG: SMC-Scp complex subunit ScpB [Candidatus Omnitrophica bacterium]|nr:SMC-Scp complex subunit ScpB [Candidatus Omnitrophota bacterium]
MSPEEVKLIIEALLFVNEKPLTLEAIKGILEDFNTEKIREILEELKKDYETQNRGIRIQEVAGGFQMVTNPYVSPYLKKFFKKHRIERLSQSALETLSIIAYKQPVTKKEIEILRNVDCSGVIKHLLEKNLIRIVGRRDSMGRPFVYRTPKEFLEYFGLKSLEDLPKLEDFSKLAKGEESDGEPTGITQEDRSDR